MGRGRRAPGNSAQYFWQDQLEVLAMKNGPTCADDTRVPGRRSTGARFAPCPRRARRICGWLAGLCLLFTLATVQGQPSRAYQLKAVFLYNFAQFTEWPTNTFPSEQSPIIIGVLGTDPFGPALDETVRGEAVHGRKLVVERYRRIEDVKTCHILFITTSQTPQLDPILAALKGRPILTVSDIDDAAKRGVMIRLVTEGNKIRFRINLVAAQESNLTLSSKLLRVADIVGGNP
jgi:hypothetical protein